MVRHVTGHLPFLSAGPRAMSLHLFSLASVSTPRMTTVRMKTPENVATAKHCASVMNGCDIYRQRWIWVTSQRWND